MKSQSGILLLVVLFSGCAPQGTGGSGRVAARFPSREELRKIERAPSPPRVLHNTAVEVDSWDLTGPLPEAVELAPHHDDTPWNQLLAEAAEKRQGLVYLSESMHCAAREVGLFYLDRNALPSESLRHFILSRCGAASEGAGTAWISGEIPEGADEKQIYAKWEAQLRDLIGKQFVPGPQEAGVWFGRKGKRAVAMVTEGRREVQVERIPLVPDEAGNVVLRGELLIPAASVRALVNRGRFGYRACEVDSQVSLPRFTIRCQTSKEDAFAWIEMAAFPAGRIMGSSVLTVLASPAGAPGKRFAQSNYGVAKSAPGPLGSVLLEMINQVRKQAEMAPLALAVDQTETATRVAPHYFAATLGSESELMADRVVLGLRAGWDVDGLVHNGWFTAAAIAGSTDPAVLLTRTLERPSGREALLEPSARQLALGPVIDEQDKVLAAVLTTYSLFEATSYVKEEKALFGRLTALRFDHHLPPPIPASNVAPILSRAAKRIEQGESTPRTALKTILDQTVETLHVPARGFTLETSSLDAIEFPKELLTLPAVTLGISITHYRSPDDAWGRYVIFFLVTDELTPG